MRRLALLLLLARSTRAFDFEDEEDDAPTQGGAQPAFFSDEGGTSVALEHSFNGGPFTTRSKLFYRDSKHYVSATGAAGRASARVAQGKLGGAELDGFQALLATGGYYTLRLPSVLSQPDSPPVMASVSVCSLAASRFEEQIHLNMLTNGRVTGLSYLLPKTVATCPAKGLPRLALDEVLFNTTVTVLFPEEGAKPLGKVPDFGFLPPVAMQKVKQQTEGGEGEGAPKGNESFLRKYWMYILPAVILMTMGGGEEPPAKGGGGAPAAKK
tara:strand:+ start:107 stop:913 length:807 start_codon:yes stop_codon:yes gene_type:complete